jgi:hypothetical protein
MRNQTVHPSVRFIVLGAGATQDGDGEEFASMVQATGREDQFVLFSQYVPHDLFASYLMQSDVVLPLLHPGTQDYTHYRFQQVSGAFLLAIGYSLPMLLDRSWEGIEDFRARSFFYGPGELIPTLNDIVARRSMVSDKLKEIGFIQKYSFASQQQRYLSLLT